jgi:hypothetical protein
MRLTEINGRLSRASIVGDVIDHGIEIESNAMTFADDREERTK